MKAQFIYSVAALATFPIVVNAQVDAENTGAITIQKNETSWTKTSKELAKGKYSFLGGINAFGANAVLKIEATGVDLTKTLKKDEPITADFELAGASTVKITVTAAAAMAADASVAESKIQLNFDFTKVAQLLKIEYNKVTNALAAANYEEKAQDAQGYSALYDRIVAIAGADYAFYAADTEGLQAIAGDQTVVTGLKLYQQIGEAYAVVLAKEKKYQLNLLDGDDGLGGLLVRYNALAESGDVISYQTKALNDAKKAAEDARDAYNTDATAENLTAAKTALGKYGEALALEEGVKKANEEAHTSLLETLSAVYGGTNSYYNTTVTQINTLYTARYADLKKDLLPALEAIVTGEDYTSVTKAIQESYEAKTAKSKKSDLEIKIYEFKQKLTQKVSDFNTVKEQLTAVYVTYDAEKEAADKLVKDAKDFLETYKQAVDKAVKDLLDFIEANDEFTTVANLTDAKITAYGEAITAAKAEYTKQAGIYADYLALKDEVKAQTTSLDGVKDDIDKDAKDTKKLSEEKFKPTTLWNTTITGIVDKITALDGAVETNKTDATAFKAKNEYKNALKTIKDAIKSLKDNALQATALFAGYYDEYTTADELQKALMNPAVEPTDDLTKLNVWTNQVTIDDAVKARTPYKNFIDNTEGSITKAIAALDAKLNVMDANTGPLKGYKGTILDYLKTDGVKNAATAVTTGTATMEAIKANYKADEQKFAQQMDIEECNGIRTNINNKAVVFEAAIDVLEKNIEDGLYGKVKGKKLQDELDAITKKIDDAKAVAAKEDATKDDLTKAYNSIKDLMDTDIATATTHADNYKNEFAQFKANYELLNGTKDDTSAALTVFGLKKKVAEQKEVIGNYKDLTDAQKTTFKNNVDAVEYKTKEGDPLKDVTYTIDNILTFIENAMQAEELKDAEVTKYQNIINELKGATMAPVVQASYMNDLEGALKAIDFAKAKADVLKADPNESGFYYLLLTGTTTKGQYTKDFNDLKAKIEADTEITLTEKGTYNDEIIALKALVDDAAAKAKANLDAFKDAKKHYSNVPAAGSSDIKGAVQRYDEAWEKLLKCPSSKLEEQKTVITGMKAKLDQLRTDAETSYNNGKAVADDFVKKIDDQIKDIENKVEEFTNEANYNAQVAADNKAVYDRILAAREAVDAVYATSATVINTYKNFQSTELKAAADQAKTELQALLIYLEGYDAAVGKIKTDAKTEYDATVSPAFFDKDETYKAKYEAIQKEIEDLTKALTDKINEFAGAKVAESVKNYTDAIDASKAKVVKFSVDDKDLTTAVLNNLFKNIDKLLKDINDVKEDGTKINLLDAALVAAAKEKTGIYALIPPVEQNQAQTALNDIIAQNTNSNLLTGDDLTLFKKIKAAAESTSDMQKVECVNKFSTWKANLNDLKKKADQIAKDNKAIADAKTAINTANQALGTLNLKYQDFAAGYQVKETVEQIAADLEAYDATKVTATNAADWEADAKAISERIEAVYVALYGFEVPVIEGLIAQAKEELLTYAGADKATMAEAITIQEGKLKKAKDDVDAYLKDPKKGKSQKAALLEDLYNIESALNGYIKAMKDANGTNLDAVIVANLEAEVKVQEDILDAAPANYSTAIQTALMDEFKAIKADITTLKTYITTHKDEMSAYQANAEAMLKDIKDAIVALKAKADDLKAKEEAAAAEQAQIALANTWKTAQGLLDDADEDIAFMKSQLEAYGNGSKYANKVSKLDEQFIAANAILTAAKAEADAKEKTADKQKVATKAVIDITNALVGLADNCDDVVDLSKAAYIDAFIADLTAQIIEDSWSNSENYTTTDKKTLTTMRDNLIQSVALLKGNAESKNQAGNTEKNGVITYKGVITTLNEGATQFGKDLNALVQAVKDLSLAEDVKGHITGGDEIGADDVQALINIIINGQEGEQDLEICDINGDGRITVTDIIWLQFFDIFHEWPNMAATARGGYEMSDAVKMEVVSTRGNITRLAINLSNNDSYRAFQIGMQLPAGAKVVGQSLGDRVENAYLMHSQATEGNVRFMTIAFNSEFAGNEGAVLYVDVENLNGDVALTEAYFTNVELNEADLLSSGQTTSIRESITNALESAGQKIYNMGGRVMNGLKKGINIIRRNDGSNEKVIVK